MTKTALITGGSKGIGLAIAKGFAAEGYALKLVARQPESLELAKQELLKEFNIPVQTYALNLSVEQDLEKLTPAFSDVDVLVNSAGYRMSSAGAINMFPHTAHVESMAVFDLA